MGYFNCYYAKSAKKKFVYLDLNEYHLQNSSKLTNEAIESGI